MIFSNDAKPLTLDGQYIVPGNITSIRERFFDLINRQLPFLCKVKTNPYFNNPADEFNHLNLIDYSWGDCGELEFIDLFSNQTLVRFYLPGPFELSELEKYERAIRQNLSRQRIGLWFYETIGWTPKVIEIFAEELFEHKVDRLRGIESLVVDRLGLSPYPLSYFQILPAPQIGISQTQSHSLQPQAGISQTQWDSPQLPVGISQIQTDNPHQPVWISQLEMDSPRPQPGIAQIPPGTHLTQAEVDWDIPREHPIEESDISLNREDRELLRLWNDGLPAKEIGIRTGKTGKTVSNRLSVLRGMFGEERIPLRKTPTRKELG
jgi:hypothetical protein